jgi:predicted XRE-type DNA-binding protein
MDETKVESTDLNPSNDVEVTESTGNVFSDLGFEDGEAENLKLRARLMVRLRRFIKEFGMTQNEAADFFEVSQPRISNLVNKKVGKFSIDKLVNMLSQAGLKMEIGFTKSDSSSDREDPMVEA